MTEFASRLEIGDFYVEYAGTLLGQGEVTLQLSPGFLEIRRDCRHTPRGRSLTALTMRVTVELGNLDNLLDVLLPDRTLDLAALDNVRLTDGNELKLHPVRNGGRQGFLFPRAFWESAESRNRAMSTEQGELRFRIEPDRLSGICFSRLGGALRPAGLAERVLPDPVSVARNLVDMLAAPLDAVVDETLFRGCFAPDKSTGSFGLFTEEVTLWSAREPRRMAFALKGRFPSDDKDAADRALVRAADFLHGHELTMPGIDIAGCQVQKLALATLVSDNGLLMTDDALFFQLLL